MKKVIPVRVDYMKNDDCLALFQQVVKIAEQCFGSANHEITKEFVARFDEFKQALSDDNSTAFKAMYAADIATDEIWRGLNDEIRAGQRHPNPGRREATNVVAEIFGHYEDPTQLPYAEEYARIRQLIQELETLPESTLKAAVVDEWLSALRQRYEVFMEASREHMLESSFGDIGSVKKSRLAANNAYRQLMERISVLAEMPEREDCRKFADLLNQYVSNSPYNIIVVKRDRRSLMG